MFKKIIDWLWVFKAGRLREMSLFFKCRLRHGISDLNHCYCKAHRDLWDGALRFKFGSRGGSWLYPEIIIHGSNTCIVAQWRGKRCKWIQSEPTEEAYDTIRLGNSTFRYTHQLINYTHWVIYFSLLCTHSNMHVYRSLCNKHVCLYRSINGKKLTKKGVLN